MATPIKSSSPSTTVNLILGGIAGLLSAGILQPLDLLKTRLQQASRPSLGSELKRMAQWLELWRGTVPLMIRTGVGAGLYFTSLLTGRHWVALYKARHGGTYTTTSSSVLPKLLPLENLALGSLARASVGYLTMPITVIKTRYESNQYHYRLMREAVVGTYYDGKPTGSIANFFKGSIATLARDLPYAGLYVLFYEGCKSELSCVDAKLVNSTLAFLAASAATTVTAPFDAIKTRLQLDSLLALWQATRDLCLEPGGVANLFRGLSLRLLRKGLSAAISWGVYEELIKSRWALLFLQTS